ncbi:PAS and ANTAR domain-containing protein [Rhodococcus ruber]|uniref:PAS and ANTAR domain-containing protein n=1 Tax=Rhodococcus TaxID=1827 RepID=UPI00029A4A42|nr:MULTISPECIES: PAS and ANTAR domain-containing protein [Rhodococcus]RIK12105.1 MAG: ANTAR domain-containing protein [Acidobacteriota bacterium]ATQ28881.1 transcription antitermination regulator [Rhodococcus ruber]QRE82376.1 ANTAR domain-containing protein [Rhodococcus ruber]WKK09806.1 PAS and ANTAR domain-containing protein [Rhodococcus ruber]WML61612.1 PAS and ANTAR domain-containing protein [Rhodococcus sp. AH-ZY2]
MSEPSTRISDTRAGDAFEQVFASVKPQRVGSFRYLIDDDAWEWSDDVARMHGYSPGTVRPTTELLLKHKHPDDKVQVAALLGAMQRNGEPFSGRHRIVDAHGKVRPVVVVADRLLDECGRIVGTSGFYVDLSDAYEDEVREGVDEAVSALAHDRAVIEQAKGMIMAVYRIQADHAFEILAWRSQESNVKLRALAEQLVRDVSTGLDVPTTFRNEFDHLLMTVHERVPSVQTPPGPVTDSAAEARTPPSD